MAILGTGILNNYHMSYSQYSLHNSMDMGSLSGTILGTILNYMRGPYVHYNGALNKANIDSSSYELYSKLLKGGLYQGLCRGLLSGLLRGILGL